MSDTQPFAILVLIAAGVGLLAVLSNHLTSWLKVPSPALFLVVAAVAVKAIPSVHAPSEQVVERVVIVALVFILFDGGLQIGWSRFRSAAVPITVLGVIGTFLTVVAGALFVHLAFGLAWYLSVLLATAVAATDPAVVFSVLGQREISGHSGTILEGESGANDPVGIALMTGLLAAGSLGWGALGHVGTEFLLQMGVGGAVGLAGGQALGWFTRHVPLPSEGLYPLRTLASVLVLFAVATLAYGSGFLAVFVAGIVLADGPAPYKREVERFHSALASLAEIVAFVFLGLTADLAVIGRIDVWLPGLILGVVLAFVIRPILIGLCLIPARLPRNERSFVLFAGLKGAVPILLGSELLVTHVSQRQRLYGIVVVVVVFSVVVQGGLVPTVARWLKVPMRAIELEPWSLGVRLRDEPLGIHRLTVVAGSFADGRSIEETISLLGDAWVSVVVRGGELVPVTGGTRLRAGDDVWVQAHPDTHVDFRLTFEKRSAT